MRILNPTDEAVMIHKGKVIAVMEPLSDESVKCLNVSAVERKDQQPPLSDEKQMVLWEIVERCGAQLSEAEQHQLFILLEQYADTFASDSLDLGRTQKLRHSINTGTAPPIRQRLRRFPLHKREEVRRLLKDMLSKDIVEPSHSPWASPIVLVTKKNGKTRFCVDYRKLNAVTRKDAYPLPRIDDTLDTLGGSKLFSTLDLISGYWQVELSPEDKEKTAFCTPEGHFEFKVLPFGLCNAPATFQRLMDLVLAGLQWSSCLVYLDDVIVVGRNFDEHLKNLQAVLQRLRETGLKLQPAKCALLQSKVCYLGHIISENGVSTDPAKTDTVQKWPTPTSPKELQQFLGLASYYRRFIRNFATIAKPLHRLTEKTAEFHWTAQCQDAFEELRSRLVSAPILAFPDHRKQFILDTDASDTGVGGVLSQLDCDGQERVISYASRVLSKAERRYCVTRRELLAVVTFTQHFRPYLFGKKFTLRTDHGSLKWLRNFKEPEGQLARWLEKLEEYDFDVVHRQGLKHGNADALSRLPCSQCGQIFHSTTTVECSEQIATVTEGSPSGVHSLFERSSDQLQELQEEDVDVGYVLAAKRGNKKPLPDDVKGRSREVRSLIGQWDQLQVTNGLLYRNPNGEPDETQSLQLIVPTAMRRDVLREVHEGTLSGHLGEDKTLGRLKERFYWPGYHTAVQNWCKCCVLCSQRKMPTPRRHAPLGTVRAGSPMQICAVDILGPLPKTKSGNRYILVLGDYFTRWMEAYAIPNQEAITVAQKLVDECFCRFSVPEQLHSDQGRQFESTLISEMCKILQIHKTRTTPYHPQSDGMVERFNRTLLSMLSIVTEKHSADWEDQLPKLCFAYNSSVHSTTGFTPFYLMFGRQARLPIDLMFGLEDSLPVHSPSTYASQTSQSLVEAYQLVRERLQTKHLKEEELYNRKVHGPPLQEGEKVWLFTPAVPRGDSRKLHRPWTGPYKVLKKLSEVNYRIQHLQNYKKRVVHFDRLKPYSSQASAGNTPRRNTTTNIPPVEPNGLTAHATDGFQLELVEDVEQPPPSPSTPDSSTQPTPTAQATQPSADSQSRSQTVVLPPPVTRRYPQRIRKPVQRTYPYVYHGD